MYLKEWDSMCVCRTRLSAFLETKKIKGTMRFIQTHSMGSDCTAPYDIVDYQAKTAVEFINEMLQQCKSEWGDIEVWADNKPLDHKRIKYDRGKLLDEFPDTWKYKEVTKVIAAGGWGKMDYRIYVKA